MRIAAIDDLHGNLPALEAAIGKIRQQGVDRVVGGDVLPGPMPVETLERLRDRDLRSVYLRQRGGRARTIGGQGQPLCSRRIPVIRWTAERLLPEHRRFLKARPKTLGRDLPGGAPITVGSGSPGVMPGDGPRGRSREPFRPAFAPGFPESNGDNCLLTPNFRFVDLPFSRLLA
jgi:hypothetical protein